MRNKIIFTLALVLVVFLFNSCETPPIEAAQDAYNYNAIAPKVLNGIQGTGVAYQTTSTTFTINYYRGGSTWQWSAANAEVVSVSDDTRTVTVKFTTAGTATISVVEVTAGGVTSEAATKNVTVNAFCPWTADDFVGTWVGTEAIGTGDPVPITVHISKVSSTVVKIDAQDGTPGLLQSVYTGWGETFQASEGGLVGDIELILGLGDGTISLEKGKYWGTTLPGPYPYWYAGSGNWDGCASSISVHFEMHWDDANFNDGGNRYCQAILVKQ